MFSKKPFADLSNKTEKELLILQTQAILESEKHINRIKDNVLFYFYVGLIGIIVFLLSTV